jgi:hypothetical protein
MKRRRWLRIAAWVIAPVLLLAGAFVGFELLKSWHFNPGPPEANYPKPRDALEAQRQDLAHFRKLIAMDRAYSPAARTEAERRIAELERRAQVFRGEELRVALLRIVALADNGHTSLYSGDGGRANLVPVRLTLFSDGLYVLRAKAEHADLLGARLVAIEGRPIDEVMATLSELRGGIPSFRRTFAALIVQSPGILHGAGIGTDPGRSTWRFVKPNGETVERVLTGLKTGDDEPWSPSALWLSAKPLKGETPGWRPYATDDAKLPLTIRDFDRVFRRAWVNNSCVLLISMKAVQDENGESIDEFLAATEAEMKARRPCAVILDQRFNGGGDYTNVGGFSARLPGLMDPDGKIYALTTAETFSAAITMTGFVKQAAPGRVVILGEPVGDRMTFWSEGNSGCLPHAKLCVHYATGKHAYTTPCKDWSECYWTNLFYPVEVDGFGPDEQIAFHFADYAAGRDPVFDRAVQLATPRP